MERDLFVVLLTSLSINKVTMKRIVVLLLMILLIRLTGLAQGFEKPPEGKAIIHIVFGESPGSNVVLYLGDSLIGGFGSNQYTSLIVDPGSHKLMAWNDGLALLEAEVAANGIYMVLLEGTHNDNAFPIRFIPVKDGSTRFWQLKRMIGAKPPSQGNRGAPVNYNDQNFDEVVPARVSHLAEDMDVGKRHFEVPPISH